MKGEVSASTLAHWEDRKSEKKIMKRNPKRTTDDKIPKAKLIISV